MLLANIASIPTITGAIEGGYAHSEANSGHCDGYVTDHTDLGSDIDESEYRRELLNDVSLYVMLWLLYITLIHGIIWLCASFHIDIACPQDVQRYYDETDELLYRDNFLAPIELYRRFFFFFIKTIIFIFFSEMEIVI